MSDLEWVDQLKVADLKKELKKIGENTTGKKAVLVERLKTALAEQGEQKEDIVNDEEQMEMEADMEEKKEEESAKDEGDVEKKTPKGGLNELLGDGKDDLEFVFESEKPVRKKQKLEDKTEEDKKMESGMPATPEKGSPTTEKKMTEEDLVDFETAHQDVREPGMQQAAEGIKADVMELEAPVIAEEDRTCALRIQNFVRPFTEKAAREMLGAYGTVVDMWMPPIKTHCYVIYKKESEAHDAYLGTYNVVWPRSGRHLLPKFVSVDEAKKAIEDGRSRAAYARASGSVSYQNTRPTPSGPTGRGPQDDVPRRGSTRSSQKSALSLEDLFFKTQAKPPIYYLPLTDEQVAEKKRLAKEREAQATQPSQESAKDE